MGEADNSCVIQCNETLKSVELKLQSCFVELVSGFLKCCCSGNDCFRPLPPRLGNGDSVDLLKLYFVVKFKGGVEAISKNNLWGEVGAQCGFDSGFGSAFKLIYAKYLGSLESWIVNLKKEKCSESESLMEVLRKYRAYASKIMNVKKKLNKSDGSNSSKLEKSGISFIDLTEEEEGEEEEEEENGSQKLGWKKLVMDFADSEGSNEGFVESVKLKKNAKMSVMDAVDSTVKSTKCRVGMSFTGARDCTEGNGDSVESKQQDVVMDYGNGEGVVEEVFDDQNSKQVNSETSSVGGITSGKRRFLARPVVGDDVVKSSENSVDSKKCSTKDDEEEMMNVDSGVLKEVSSRKRKRDRVSEILEWMANVAKNPTDPVIGEMPQPSRWASYGNDKSWKQAVVAREALFLEKIYSAELYGCQKKLKTLPSLFNQRQNVRMGTSYQTEAYPVRLRQRLETRLDMQPTASIYTSRPQQRIPIGKAFQAEVPKWTGVPAESDSKWLGTRTWPLEKAENLGLVERDPVGKGRMDNCGCQFPGSAECVKFHVAQRRMKMRFELGSAFYSWKFDKMGENCSVSWTHEEEKRFRSIIKENPQSSQKCFWEPMCRALPHKRWADQVNYYYNVFILQRRGYQNRHNPNGIDSDDDETEYRSTNNSIRCGSA